MAARDYTVLWLRETTVLWLVDLKFLPGSSPAPQPAHSCTVGSYHEAGSVYDIRLGQAVFRDFRRNEVTGASMVRC